MHYKQFIDLLYLSGGNVPKAFEAAGYPLPKDYKPLEPTPLQIKPLGDVKAMPKLVVIDSLSEISSRKQK